MDLLTRVPPGEPGGLVGEPRWVVARWKARAAPPPVPCAQVEGTVTVPNLLIMGPLPDPSVSQPVAF